MNEPTPHTARPETEAARQAVSIPVSKLPNGFTAVAPRSFDEAWRLATLLSRSDMVPKDYRDRTENCMVAILWGMELGLSALQAIQNIAVINGRPALWGDLALAIVQQHPTYEGHREEALTREGKPAGMGDDVFAYRCTVKRKGSDPHVVVWSVADAVTAGLWKKPGPWTNYPQRMLQMRARSWALRDQFPDALRGLGFIEEAQDINLTTDQYAVVSRAPVAEPVKQPTRRIEVPAPVVPEVLSIERQEQAELMNVPAASIAERVPEVAALSNLYGGHHDTPEPTRDEPEAGAGPSLDESHDEPLDSAMRRERARLTSGMEKLINEKLQRYTDRGGIVQDFWDSLGDTVHAGNFNKAVKLLDELVKAHG